VARKHFIRAGVRALAAVCERIDAEVDALVEARAG
jgi:hypothetical protein